MQARALIPLAIVATVAVFACQRDSSDLWFDGDLTSAQAKAGELNTVVMIEFYVDWCNWCRRLEADTLSAPVVQRELAKIVAMRRNGEEDGAELARRFRVDSYPMLVFLDPEGNELDRVTGYLPPERFLSRLERIRSGDTFLACLRQLEDSPGDREAIERAVAGLLERSDAEGAISRIDAFHAATEGKDLNLCRKLMFDARSQLHGRVYQRAAKLYRSGWNRSIDVPDTAGTSNLHALMGEGISQLSAEEQAEHLRRARHEDAADLLEIPDLQTESSDTLFAVADFAFRNGHYDVAADVYLRWYARHGAEAESNMLNDVAWRLYLSGQKLDHAIEIAQDSYALHPEPETADTLARLLYVTGSVREAIALEEQAARETEGSRSENYTWVAQRMSAGESLDDKPNFESYPGRRRRGI